MIYGNVCMKSKTGLKREEERKGPHTCSVAWPCMPCCALQSQAAIASAVTFPKVWGHSTATAPADMGKHGPTPASPTFSQQSPSRACCIRAWDSSDCSLMSQIFGSQVVIWHCFMSLTLATFSAVLFDHRLQEPVCLHKRLYMEPREDFLWVSQITREGQQVQPTCGISKATGKFTCSTLADFLLEAKLEPQSNTEPSKS